jgi:DNA-binding SARP family transcriptional activator
VPARSTLEIRLLGEATVRADGEPLDAFDSPRLLELVARLVLQAGTPIDRSTLAYALWPESSDTQARTNLRHLLHDLRRALPDVESHVEITNAKVVWRADAPATVDVIEFVCAIEAGDLRTAVDHYGGALLPGSYSDDVLAERQRLADRAADAIRQLATEADGRDANDDVIDLARRLLAIDPLSEVAYQFLMTAHAARGERATALRQYHTLVDLLATELGVEPSPATQATYASLSRSEPADAPTAESPVATRELAPSTLIGRDAEWAVTRDTWAAARAGRAQLLVVTGEPGVGKSRLLEELTHDAAAQSARVARSRSYPTAGRDAWGPVIDWLRTEPITVGIARLDATSRDELGRLLVPELGATSADRPRRSDEVDPALRRRRLLEAATAVLATDEPTLLAIDDLQWCDADTLDLIGFALRHRTDDPLLIAATLRDHEVEPTSPVSELIDALHRDGLVVTVPLEPLGPSATGDLVRQLAPHAVDDDTVARLHDETGGNPLFVVEAMRAGLADVERGSMPLTPTVQAVIRSRLHRLNPETQDLLEIAAVLGRDFSVEELSASSDAELDDVVDRVDELWRHRIIGEQRGTYDFTHDLIRAVAQAAISPARRRRLHAAVATGLVTVHGRDRGPVSARLAWHLEESGDIEGAIAARRDAAAWALEVLALDDAIESLQRAIALLDRLPAGESRDATELELREALGVPLVDRDGYSARPAYETYERALVLSRRLGRPAHVTVHRGLGLADIMSCHLDRAAVHAQALLDSGDDDPTAAVEGHYLSGVGAFWRGELQLSATHLRAAIDTYRDELGPQHRALYGQDPKAVCMIRLAITQWFLGLPDESMATADAAREFAVTLDHPISWSYVFTYSQMLSLEAGRLDEVEEMSAATAELWQRYPMGSFTTIGPFFPTWVAIERGDPTAIERLRTGVTALDGVDQRLHLTHGLALLARALLRSGDVAGGRAAVAEGLDFGRSHGQLYLEPELLRLDGLLLAASDDRIAAADAITAAIELADSQGSVWLAEKARESLRTLEGT